MTLQEAIERFLSDTERRRSDVTVRRYGEAMELLQSHLALEQLDPDAPGESPPVAVGDVTPEALRAFIHDFLGERLLSNERAQKRYVAATRSFVQWLTRTRLVSETGGRELLEVLKPSAQPGFPAEAPQDGAAASPALELLPFQGGDASEEDAERYFQVLEVRAKGLVLLDVETAQELGGDPPADEAVEPGDLVAGVPGTRRGRPWVSALRLVAAEEDLEDDAELEDWDDDLFGDDSWSDGDPVLVEDALEILASEDRYAPREVVRVILASFDEARDDLLDWLTDDDYRNEPLPGAGEAPANAARLLSEVREEAAIPRLLSVLGDGDPLGEEAPPALGRYGRVTLEPLQEILRDGAASDPRRGAAVSALTHLAARNPALRGEVALSLARELPESPAAVRLEILQGLEDLRAVEVLDLLREQHGEGRLDLEAHDRTLELVESRMTSDGWGERLAESLLPVAYLYPTNEELEEFYESLEEDLADFWDLMTLEDEEDDPPDGGNDGGLPGEGEGPSGGKVIPFRRPRA